MATGLLNTSSPNQYASPTNPNGAFRPVTRSSAANPYQGNLQTSFTPNQVTTVAKGQGLPSGYASSSNDPDVIAAQGITNEIDNAHKGIDQGVSYSADQALLNLYLGRIGQKNSLAEQIGANPGQERQQESILTGQAGQSLGSGLKSTRQNYNSRGLLYSGMREGGEQQTKNAVASNLDASISGTRRDAANSLQTAKNAYASVDLANAQQSLQLANQAFDTASANNIARLQAMQQLGGGFGSALGSYFGSQSAPAPTSVNAGPSGPSNYNTASTGNYYDSPAMQQGLVQRTA